MARVCLAVAGIFLLAGSGASAANDSPSPHAQHRAQFGDTVIKNSDAPTDDAPTRAVPSLSAATNIADPNFIVFGYHPYWRDGLEYHYKWHALTHAGYAFVDFSSTASLDTAQWDSRPGAFKAGGAAEANGVKVLFVLANAGFSVATLDTVMQSASLRQTLINNVMAEVTSDSYCGGVSLDFEFNWGTATRDGITDFIQDLRAALDAVDPALELNIYVNPTYSGVRHDVPAISPYIDHMLLSCYPWAGDFSTVVGAISPANNFIVEGNDYIDAGLPPEKLVLAISAYGHQWFTNSPFNYGSTVSSTIGPISFVKGMYDTTINSPSVFTNNYQRGPETGWYNYTSGGTRTVVWDDDESMEYKLRLAQNWPDPDGFNNGRRIGGVGFWDLGWLATDSSFDPISGTGVTRTRTYPHVYQLCEEIFRGRGETSFSIERFEGPESQRDFRWRDPNESPDTTGDTDNNSAIAQIAAPTGLGAPPDTGGALQVFFDFENASGNRLFVRHEILRDDTDTTVNDVNSAEALVSRNTAFIAWVHVGGSGYTGRQVRLVAFDGQREVEMSDPFAISAPGWHKLEWDLTDGTQINAWNTAEPALLDGDGVIDSAGGGAKDIGFLGLFVEGGAAGTGTLYFDEIGHEHRNPGGADYTINEFRYAGSANEFLEIHGPTGTLPAGMQIRHISGADGSATTFNVTGTVPNDGGGFGFFVVGDTGVPNVDLTTGFSTASDNFPSGTPSGLQLYSSSTGCVYDSLVYQAKGGLGDLIRQQTLGITANGYPWIGEITGGTTASAQPYTMGRYPDGANTHINFDDFSFMGPTPGAANGGAATTGLTTGFASAPTGAFQTFGAFAVGASGVGASSDGGNVYRCVDTSGGGSIGVIGDAALGADGNGYRVAGEIYIPASGEPEQANGIGICGRMGSRFFTSTAADITKSGYESGYWLIYENRAGVGLNDGRADHPGVFEFVYATNDGQDGIPVELLNSRTLAQLGITAGSWVDFELEVNPSDPTDQLVARLNNADVYRGALPVGGPISGAFQVGFRENHAGAPAANEGTWIDGLSIADVAAAPTADMSLALSATTDSDALIFDVLFSEPVAPTFTISDITPTGTLAPGALIAIGGLDPDYQVVVVPASADANGTLGISIGGGVTNGGGVPYAGGSSALYTVLNFGNGDVNKDGVVDLSDVAMLADYNLGLVVLP